jgi:hypothetical protein
LSPSIRALFCFSGFLLLKKPAQAFTVAKIKIFSRYPLFYGRSFWNISLAIWILNKFFWLRPMVHFSPPGGHIPDEEVERIIKNEK